MRILITGNKGYIGNVLTKRLAKRRELELIGLDSGLFDDSNQNAPLTDIEQQRKDIRDVVAEDLEGVECVIHLAALSNDPLGNLDAELTKEINFEASVRLAEIAKAVGVRRFLFSSSCSVYGAGSGDMWFAEGSECYPVTPYAKSKLDAEAGLSNLASDNFEVVFLRNATAYGAGDNLRFDLAVNNLVAWALSTGKILIKSDGLAWRPFVHVDDIAQAFELFIDARLDGEERIFNIGETAENFQVKDVAEMILAEIPETKITFGKDAEADTRNYRVNCDRVLKAVSFKAHWSVEKGIKELHKELRGMDLTPEQFEGPKYNRISHLRKLLANGEVDESLRWIEG